MTACTYCGCDVTDHEPVSVVAGVSSIEDSEWPPEEVDAFCNYACLSAHIDEAGLTTGATCEIDL